MKITQKNILIYVITLAIWIFALWQILNIPFQILIMIIVSVLIIYLISKKKNFLTIYITIFIIIINLLTIVFTLIPTYSKNVELSDFYKKQENILKIDIQNTKKLQKNRAKIFIKNSQKDKNTIIELWKQKKDIEKKIYSGDSISFISKTKDLDTLATIYLWDWTIIRLLPQSTIKMNKLIKNTQKLTDSQTQIEVDKWQIRFNVIKTITNKEWFNIETSNWTLVIRGTAGFIEKNSQKNTMVYSHNHIIEIKNKKWETKLLPTQKAMLFSNEKFSQINLENFYQKLNQKIRKKIKKFPILDKEHIKQYKKHFKEYIKKNFSRILDQRKKIETISYIKMKILSFFDKKYEKQIQNYRKYKTLTSGISIEKYLKRMEQYVFIPINQNTQRLKKKILKKYSKINEEGIKNYIINLYNEALDKWVDVDINNLEKNMNKGIYKIMENKYIQNLEKFYLKNIHR